MPFRVNDERTTVHVMVPAEWPSAIYDACGDLDIPSNTRFIQEAIAWKLAVDDREYADLIARLDATCPSRNMRRDFGAKGPVEEVV